MVIAVPVMKAKVFHKTLELNKSQSKVAVLTGQLKK